VNDTTLLGGIVFFSSLFWAVVVWIWANKYKPKNRRRTRPQPNRWERKFWGKN
jgi:hypothetical protein